MTDDLPTLLEAMYHSGEIMEFICARMPSGKLTTGWMEHGLLLKGFTGRIEDKINQERLIIPADRFSRLVRDLEAVTQSFVGLLIIGHQGLMSSKLCVLVYNETGKDNQSMMTVAFWTKKLSIHKISNAIARYVLGRDYSTTSDDSDLDYVEKLKADTSTGDVRNLLTLKAPSAKQNITEWINEPIKPTSRSDRTITMAGDLKSLSKFAVLFTRWLTSLEIFRRDEGNIATIMMNYDDRAEFCFWDNPQRMVSFFSTDRFDAENVTRRYLIPLWSTSEDIASSKSRTPEVIVSKRDESSDDRQGSIIKTKQYLDNTVLKQIAGRVETIEARLYALENTPREKIVSFDQSLSIMQNKLSEVISRLESTASRLSDLEKRIEKLSRATR